MTPYILVDRYKLFCGTFYLHIWKVRVCPEDAVGLSEIIGTWIIRNIGTYLHDVTAQQSLILIVKLLPNCGVSNLGYYTINELPK